MKDVHETAHVDPSAEIGDSVRIGPFSVVGAKVSLGDGCVLGAHVVVHADSVVGANVRIDDGAVLGKLPMKSVNSAITELKERPALEVGEGAIIGTHAVLYRGAKIGRAALIADHGAVREDTEIGVGTIVGRGAYVENKCHIGQYVKIESMAYVAAFSSIADRAFIAPMVTTTNDNFVGRTKERFDHFKGVTVEKGGRVGANTTLLPGAVIGEDALVGAGSIVRGEVEPKTISLGQPAKPRKPVPEEQLLKNQGWSDVD